ncbi:MAG: molybdopterin molybdotransferase MoeA [Sediminibacterium sp.]
MEKLISPEEAFRIVKNQFLNLQDESVALASSSGRELAENIYSDRDQPPFHRVMMDGYAFKYSAWEKGIREFYVEGIQAAGNTPSTLKNENGCMEVMTGAVLPNECSVVIQYEKSIRKEDCVQFQIEEVKHFQNIQAKGFDQKEGAEILTEGITIGPLEIAALASVGKGKVKVVKQFSVAIVSTGNELVEVHETPADYEIRSSNLEMLQALLSPLSSLVSVFRLSDDEQETSHFIQHELENFDIVCFSGGVSKGKYDFVAKALEDNNVQKHFHGVKQRPGKPFFFGSKKNVMVFAFPGNPISVLHCATRYLLPHLRNHSVENVRCISTYKNAADLTVYIPAFISTNNQGNRIATIVRQNGSGDYMGALGSNGFIEVLPNQEVKENEVISFYKF